MPGIGWIEATQIITAGLPDTHLIVLTTFDDEPLGDWQMMREHLPT